MRLDEIAQEPVYLRVSKNPTLNSGKYRVKSMTPEEGGYDVGITGWTDGLIFVPHRTTYNLMFVAANGQPITPEKAYSTFSDLEEGAKDLVRPEDERQGDDKTTHLVYDDGDFKVWWTPSDDIFEITEMQEDGWVEGSFKAKAYSVTSAEKIAEKYMTTKWYEGDINESEEPNVNIRVHQTDQWTDEGNPADYESDVTNTEYEVIINNYIMGELVYDDYFGYLTGTLGNRGVQLELKHDEWPEDAVKRYFATPTGQKHLKVMGFA